MKQPANVKAVSNNEVREAFARRESAHASNFVSTGDKLLSYGWYEIARWFGDTVWIRGGKLYSQTTKSKHMSGLVTLLSIRGVRFKVAPETDFDESDMKLPETWRDYAQNEGSDTYYVLEFAYSEYQGDVISGVVEQALTLEQAKWLVDNPQAYHAPAIGANNNTERK
jgi:hypothetical protein